MKVLESASTVAPSQEMTALLEALIQLRRGDSSVRLPVNWLGLHGKVADVFNELVEQNATMASELARLRQVVGKEGKLKQRAALSREARGFWSESIESLADRRPGAPDQRGGARDRRRGPGRPEQEHGAGGGRAANWKASSCAPPRPSTRWSSSWATSRPR